MIEMIDREYYEGMIAESNQLAADNFRRAKLAEMALDAIWKIVHTPTKLTRHRTADDHFQADFDSIRKIIADTRSPQEIASE